MRREKAMTKSVKRRITNILLFVILSLGAVLILFPIAWMLSTALKSAPEIAMYPPKLLPEKPMFENFAIAWSKAPFTRYTINTLIIVFFTIIGNVLVNSFVAYGFAKIDFAGKKFLFNVILATMMIPGFVTLVPTYVIFSKLQWVNTYLPLIVPAFCGKMCIRDSLYTTLKPKPGIPCFIGINKSKTGTGRHTQSSLRNHPPVPHFRLFISSIKKLAHGK